VTLSPPSPQKVDSGSRPLQRMFETVPRRYDLMNRMLTLRLDERWRRKATTVCLEHNPARVMDLCAGTGDLALRLADHAPESTEIVAADFCEPMLAVARRKAARKGHEDRIRFVNADAAALPFPDASFDSVGIAFGFRNLTFHNPKRDAYLEELARVVAPGGRLVIVETSQPGSKILRAGFHFYMAALVGPLGGFLSRRRDAYRYLAHSARRYYFPEEVSDLLRGAGFSKIRFHRLMGGVAGIHVAMR
jgi:demethylmenaquinone methyltransferase / 2-methoxy-6-polyprenyl-1,4-benzoquinol methylase